MTGSEQERVIINAAFDEEAKVWYIESSTYPGLVSEAPSLDQLLKRARLALDSLREVNGTDGKADLEVRALAA